MAHKSKLATHRVYTTSIYSARSVAKASVAYGRRGRVVVPLEVLQRERVGHVHGRQLAGGRARQQLWREPARQLVVAAAAAAAHVC